MEFIQHLLGNTSSDRQDFYSRPTAKGLYSELSLNELNYRTFSQECRFLKVFRITMKCPACGNDELQEHHRFCCNCGCKVSGLQSARETGSESTNGSQEAQSVDASDAAG